MKGYRNVLKLSMAVMAVIVAVAIFTIVFLAALRESYEPDWSPNERWVSDYPNISFVVFDEEKKVPYGQMIINDQIIEVSPIIVYRHVMEVVNYPRIEPGFISDADILMRGECDFYRDYFNVRVTFDRDGLFEGIDTITFRKEYIDTGEPVE